MTTLDWLIAAATAMFAVSGYFRGLIVGALSLGGFVAGAIAGTRVADALLSGGASSPYAPLFGLAGALVAGGVLAVGLEGVGVRLRRGIRLPFLGLADRVAGALRVYARGVGQVLLPGRLSGDYSAPQEPAPARLWFPESIVGAVLFVGPLLVATWLFGDLAKVLYFVAKEQPTPFSGRRPPSTSALTATSGRQPRRRCAACRPATGSPWMASSAPPHGA